MLYYKIILREILHKFQATETQAVRSMNAVFLHNEIFNIPIISIYIFVGLCRFVLSLLAANICYNIGNNIIYNFHVSHWYSQLHAYSIPRGCVAENDSGGHRCPLCLSESDFNSRRHTCQVYVFTITYRNWGQWLRKLFSVWDWAKYIGVGIFLAVDVGEMQKGWGTRVKIGGRRDWVENDGLATLLWFLCNKKKKRKERKTCFFYFFGIRSRFSTVLLSFSFTLLAL